MPSLDSVTHLPHRFELDGPGPSANQATIRHESASCRCFPFLRMPRMPTKLAEWLGRQPAESANAPTRDDAATDAAIHVDHHVERRTPQAVEQLDSTSTASDNPMTNSESTSPKRQAGSSNSLRGDLSSKSNTSAAAQASTSSALVLRQSNVSTQPRAIEPASTDESAREADNAAPGNDDDPRIVEIDTGIALEAVPEPEPPESTDEYDSDEEAAKTLEKHVIRAIATVASTYQRGQQEVNESLARLKKTEDHYFATSERVFAAMSRGADEMLSNTQAMSRSVEKSTEGIRETNQLIDDNNRRIEEVLQRFTPKSKK